MKASVVLWGLLAGAVPGLAGAESEGAVLENSLLAVKVSPQNGAIVSLSNKIARMELISRPLARQTPWLLLLQQGRKRP